MPASLQALICVLLKYPRSAMAFRRFVLLRDAGCTGHAQLGFGGGVREGLAHAVVHHFVLHRVAVALGHHRHRHLAGPEAVGLDGARQGAQAVFHLVADLASGQRQRDPAFQFFERFDVDGHDVRIDKDSGWCAGPDSNRHAGEGVRT